MQAPAHPLSAYRFAVAPMMAWTDRHCRYFLRRMTRSALLYTEMIHANAIRRGDRSRFLGFDPEERPLALQLGGAEPALLAEVAHIAEDMGYDEVNLNVGCPSPKVQAGRFGACLMAEPDLVAEAIASMKAATRLPITVKHRIGLDEAEEWSALHGFVTRVAQSGADRFIVHARKAWLKGLSAQQNRNIPPLRHELVHRLKENFPDLTIVLNGGLRTLDEALPHLERLDGVMLGRAAYETPYVLAEVDRRVFDLHRPTASRVEIVARMQPYVERAVGGRTTRLAVVRHWQGLYAGRARARAWRQALHSFAHDRSAPFDVLVRAASALEELPALAA